MKQIALVMAAAAILLVAGCATSGSKMEQSKISQIQKGVTTRAQVETMLGAPMNVSTLPDGRQMFFYTYNQTKPKAGFWIDTLGGAIPVLGPAAMIGTGVAEVATAGEKKQEQILSVTFQNGVVQDFKFKDTVVESSMTLSGAKATINTTEMAVHP